MLKIIFSEASGPQRSLKKHLSGRNSKESLCEAPRSRKIYKFLLFVCSSVSSFVRSSVRSFVRSSVGSFVRSLVCRLFARRFVRSFVRWFVRSFVRSSVRSFVRSFVGSLVRLFVHSLASGPGAGPGPDAELRHLGQGRPGEPVLACQL